MYCGGIRKQRSAPLPYSALSLLVCFFTLLAAMNAIRLRTIAIPAPRAQMTVSRITLFRSDRGKNGMIYTPLGTANAQADAFF